MSFFAIASMIPTIIGTMVGIGVLWIFLKNVVLVIGCLALVAVVLAVAKLLT